MCTHWGRLAGVLVFSALAGRLWAGGSGLNVVVVVNQNSTNSVQLGNYYCEKRQVPPQNVLRTSWTGGNVSWQKSDFQSVILNPLLAMLSARQLTNQIDYVLLSMDFPYRVENGGGLGVSGTNSTTSALFYGFKADYPPQVIPGSCSLPDASSNSYAGSECIFRSVAPGSSATNFLAVMLTSSNLDQAKLVIDEAVAGDGTFPTQTVYLAKSSDVFRNLRYALFDNAVFNTRLRGNCSVQRTNGDPAYSYGAILGLESGWGNPYVIGNSTFVPGGLADILTSWSGTLFEFSGQINLLMLLGYGVTGCYGTVIEPCDYLPKFPSPQNYFYQARGFSMAECYYQSVTNPYQGLLVGEPLAAPFALAPGWGLGRPARQRPPERHRPISRSRSMRRMRFTRCSKWTCSWTARSLQTLTNIPPQNNNVLYVTLNGYPTNYTVPAGATILSVAANLTLRLNQAAYSNATKVQAVAYGDRIELRSLDRTRSGAQVTVSVSNSVGTATGLTSCLTASAGAFLDTVAYGVRGYTNSGSAPAVGDYLQLTVTKTNGAVVSVAVTNTTSGISLADFTQGLVNLVNTNADLQGSDGVVAEDFIGSNPLTGQPNPQFNLRARSIGWDAAQVQAAFSSSPRFSIQPSGTLSAQPEPPGPGTAQSPLRHGGGHQPPAHFRFQHHDPGRWLSRADGCRLRGQPCPHAETHGADCAHSEHRARRRVHHAGGRHQHRARSDAPVLRRRQHEQHQQDRAVQHRRVADECPQPIERGVRCPRHQPGPGLASLLRRCHGEQRHTVSHRNQVDPAGRRGFALPGFPRRPAAQAGLARRCRAELRHPEHHEPGRGFPD